MMAGDEPRHRRLCVWGLYCGWADRWWRVCSGCDL